MPQEAPEESQAQSIIQAMDDLSLENLNSKIHDWTKVLRNGAALVSQRGPDEEPFKNMYTAIENVTKLRNKVLQLQKSESKSDIVNFYVNFALVHIRSSLAKWLESCDELSQADKEHVQLSNRFKRTATPLHYIYPLGNWMNWNNL